MSTFTTILATAEEHAEGGGLNPYLVGAIALVILLGALFALLSFAAGREHS